MGCVEGEDPELARDIERAWRGDMGEARKSVGRPPVNESGTPINVRDHTADSILARLKRDHPDLAQQVVDGLLTANAAARIEELESGKAKERQREGQ